MARILRNLKVNFASLVDMPANPGAQVMLFKRAEVEKVGRKMSQTNMRRMREITCQLQSLMSELGYEEDDEMSEEKKSIEPTEAVVEPEVTEEVVEEVEKADVVAKEMADLRKRVEAAEKRAVEFEKAAEAEREQRETQEYVAKCRDEVPQLHELEKTATVLRKCKKSLCEEDFEQLERSVKAMAKQIEKGELFVEVGKSAKGDGASAIDRMNAVAKALREADPSLTQAAAFTKAVETNQALYEEYVRERQQAS